MQNFDFEKATGMVRRLGQMEKWPFLNEAQAELARVLLQNAKDREHADRVITEISEHWDRCPTARELRAELRGPIASIPDVPKTCKIGECDGRGYKELFFLHNLVSIPGGAAYREKKQITREQYNDLAGQIDFESQIVYTGVTKCGCRA